MAERLLFRMPALGADMETGIVAKWHVTVGAIVRRGQPFVDVETHKGVIEVEASTSGVVTRLLVPEGEKVPVGTPIAEVETSGAALGEARMPAENPPPPRGGGAEGGGAVPTPVEPPGPGEARKPAVNPPPPHDWIRATPSARHFAHEVSIDLASVHGTGHHGAVVRADVERAATERAAAVRAAAEHAAITAPPEAPPPDPHTHPLPAHPTAPPMTPMRQAIAAAMARSNREIPHYYLGQDIDLRRAFQWLAEQNASVRPADRVLPGALLIWAVAHALAKFPDLNGFWVEDGFRPGSGVHPGIAIALRGGGLVTPAMHDADQKTPAEVMAALSDLVLRARTGKLRASEVTDPTITITSLGDNGCDSVFGVIYPPQVALVGFGRVRDRPVAVDGMLTVHPVVTASLAGDHRASDGHRGALFLLAVDHQLQEIP